MARYSQSSQQQLIPSSSSSQPQHARLAPSPALPKMSPAQLEQARLKLKLDKAALDINNILATVNKSAGVAQLVAETRAELAQVKQTVLDYGNSPHAAPLA